MKKHVQRTTPKGFEGIVGRIVTSNDGGPIRRILNGRSRRPTGTFTSIKAGGRAMPHESVEGELKAMWIAETATSVRKLLAQPHRLEIAVSGRSRPLVYFPDLLLEMDRLAASRLASGQPFAETMLASPENMGDDDTQTVDDITAASKFLGQIERRTLDATGIHVWGHQFHDQAAVSALLDSLLRYTAGSRRREKRLASGTVPVIVTLDPTTCEYIHVWDYAKKRNVKLYNMNRRFAKDCSWRLAKAIRKAAAEENRAFVTDDEMWEARRVYEASLVPAISGAPLREQRKLLRQLKRPKPGLAMGSTVQTVAVTPSVSGMNSAQIPNAFPASMRDDDRVPPKGPRRGKA